MDALSYMPVPPGIGMEENFFSLDDILLSHERLPCRTESAFPRLGFLEKSSESRDIPEVTNNTLINKICFKAVVKAFGSLLGAMVFKDDINFSNCFSNVHISSLHRYSLNLRQQPL